MLFFVTGLTDTNINLCIDWSIFGEYAVLLPLVMGIFPFLGQQNCIFTSRPVNISLIITSLAKNESKSDICCIEVYAIASHTIHINKSLYVTSHDVYITRCATIG